MPSTWRGSSAGTIHGWGGPQLLDGYERERRPIGRRNVDAAGWAAAGVPIWRALVTPEAYLDTPAGAGCALGWRRRSTSRHRRMHGMVGVEAGYSYAGSAADRRRAGHGPEWETSRYELKALPGARIPHMWLDDGQALQDILGDDYTLLDLKGDADTGALEAAFRARGAPLAVIRRDEARVRGVYGARCPPAAAGPAHRLARRGERQPTRRGFRRRSPRAGSTTKPHQRPHRSGTRGAGSPVHAVRSRLDDSSS